MHEDRVNEVVAKYLHKECDLGGLTERVDALEATSESTLAERVDALEAAGKNDDEETKPTGADSLSASRRPAGSTGKRESA